MSFTFDSNKYSYPSRRNVVFANKGMVATSNPYAAQAGLDVLKKGGNAIDAAVAAAMTLTIVEPTSNGIGSDAFAIVWHKNKLYGINGSGPSPKGISLEKLKERGFESMPDHGVIPINVPGAPGLWAELNRKLGKLPLTEVAMPAIDLASNGYILQNEVAKGWKATFKNYSKLKDSLPEVSSWFKTFTFNGEYPKAGDLVKLPYHAKTLSEIASSSGESFYKGETAENISSFILENGGYMEKSDLHDYSPEWVEPIKTEFHGHEVYEIPPNGHGISVLMALNTLKAMDFDGELTHQNTHKMIEAVKLAMTDAAKHITDPKYMATDAASLLSMDFAKRRAEIITTDAVTPEAMDPIKGGTVYLCVADSEGNMVSYIQSNYMGFGSGVIIPNTGVSLNNRGANFAFNEEHVNKVAGRKKSYHTIIPGFLFKDGKPYGPFGIMGGFMQPQAHVQVLTSLILNGSNPQEALDKPRWIWTGGKKVFVEESMDTGTIEYLKAHGHEVETTKDTGLFGRGEIILRDENGTYCGACEGRTDGYVAMW